VKCDVRDAHSVRDAVSQCIDTLGQLPTIVINNAAGNFVCPTERLSVNGWRTVIDIVLMGTINVTMDVGKRLIAAGYSKHSPFSLYSHITSDARTDLKLAKNVEADDVYQIIVIHTSQVRVLAEHHCVVALGKLFTPMCFCHQGV